MGKALYRTYRSKSFDEVVGQSHVTGLLENAIKQGKIAHAYLLTGPRGTGKTSVARIIAHVVNEIEYSEDPHLDIIEIDAASNRRIDDIRDLREKVHITPVSAKYKVYIIDEVHMLTGESFNALLKTLEEPPEHVIFILATTEVHKVPATIISRTQRFHFRPATTTDIVKHLTSVAKKEKIDFAPEALELIAVHAGGSFRDSMSLLDQLSGLSEKITPELVESVLGMAEHARISALLDAVESANIENVVTELDAITTAGISPVVLTEQLSRELSVRAKKNHHLYQLLDDLSEVPRAYDPQLKLVATLVRFSKPAAPNKTVASEVTKAPVIEAKPSELRHKPEKNVAPKEVKSEAKAKPESKSTLSAVAKPEGTFDWEALLVAVKKHHAPLSSVLARATMSYDDTKSVLILNFSYALHRKKLENQTYRKQLGSVMQAIFGFQPELVITDTKTTPAPLGEDEAAVAAIMGGGEPVNGTV